MTNDKIIVDESEEYSIALYPRPRGCAERKATLARKPETDAHLPAEGAMEERVEKMAKNEPPPPPGGSSGSLH